MTEPSQTRREERSRLVQPAKLRHRRGDRAVSCMIRDISSTGARLRVPLGFEAEDKVLITALAVGVDRAARVVWRNTSSIGVAFEEI